MNRNQRRDFVRKERARGVNKREAEAYAEIISRGAGFTTPAKKFNEDDKVRLNVAAIKSRKNYERMSPKYQEFVESSTDAIFTAHVERENMISLKENPVWLFWSGDLIRAEQVDEK